MRHGLTQRECEVLQLLANGRTTRQVATDLGIALSTVKTHRQNILLKYRVHTAAGAVAKALTEGVIK